MLHAFSHRVNEKIHVDMFKREGFGKNNVLSVLNGENQTALPV